MAAAERESTSPPLPRVNSASYQVGAAPSHFPRPKAASSPRPSPGCPPVREADGAGIQGRPRATVLLLYWDIAPYSIISAPRIRAARTPASSEHESASRIRSPITWITRVCSPCCLIAAGFPEDVVEVVRRTSREDIGPKKDAQVVQRLLLEVRREHTGTGAMGDLALIAV